MGVLRVLQGCYRGFTLVIEECDRGVTRVQLVLLLFYMGVTLSQGLLVSGYFLLLPLYFTFTFQVLLLSFLGTSPILSWYLPNTFLVPSRYFLGTQFLLSYYFSSTFAVLFQLFPGTSLVLSWYFPSMFSVLFVLYFSLLSETLCVW